MTNATSRRYLFVCGTPRSGTTALADLLNGHEHICLGIERFKYIAIRKGNDEFFNDSLFDRDRFLDIRESDTNVMPAGWADIAARKYDAASIIGDKVPRYYVKIKQILSRFNNSSILYISRNIGSVATSWNARANNELDAWPKENNYKRAVDEWNKANKIAASFAEKCPDRFIVVKYEELFSGEIEYANAILDKLRIDSTELFEGGYKRLMNSPRKTTDKINYEGQDDYIACYADMRSYQDVISKRIKPKAS